MTVTTPDYHPPGGHTGGDLGSDTVDPGSGTTDYHPPGGHTSGTAPDSPEQQSALALIKQSLGDWGLGSLGDWAWGEYLKTGSIDMVFLEMKDRPEYKARFAGMDELAKKGRAISESAYIDLERSYAQTLRSFGLPEQYWNDPTDFAKLIGGEVGAKEFEDRLTMRQIAYQESDRAQALRKTLSDFYGLPNADALAFSWFIDPDKSEDVLRQQFASAQAATSSLQTGFGALTKTEAEKVAGYGQDQSQVDQGFSQLAGMKELTQQVGGSKGVTRDDLLAAAFGGDAKAIEKVRRTGATRAGTVTGGGNYAAGDTGLSGLGKATT